METTNDELQKPLMPQHGLAAFEAALRDPSVPIFRRTLLGRLEPMALEDAARLASRGAHEALYALFAEVKT